MHGFEIAFAEQVANVLEGRTADGTDTHALWPLPRMDSFFDLRRKIIEVSAWTLYGLHGEFRAREEVRTFVIWSTAAHLWRLTREGNPLASAVREVELMSRIMATNAGFVATNPFARKLMPELATFMQVRDRADVRKQLFQALRAQRTSRSPNDDLPPRVIYSGSYTLLAHSTPAHFLADPALASRWTAHAAALSAGANPDHLYWAQIAQGDRKVYTFLIDGTCRATFDSCRGHLKALVVHDPADDIVYDRLAFALAHLGDVLKLPEDSDNPVIQQLLLLHAQCLRQVHIAMERTKEIGEEMERKRAQQKPVKPAWRRNTDTFLAYVVLSIALSYLVPLLIIAAPQFIRTYVDLWRIAFGLEPNCAIIWSIGPDCARYVRHSGASSVIPIPPHTPEASHDGRR
jgi:hypothetical protein